MAMPARFWKWRMHGGAVTLARRFLAERNRPEVIMATDMLDLATFLALTRKDTATVPAILYMHENQLTYPLPAEGESGPMRRQRGERDLHYAFINYSSMLAEDGVLFNSAYHRNVLLKALPNFLRHFPEFNELESVAMIEAKSGVLPVGVDLRRLSGSEEAPQLDPPLILWNQRWEYDKNPGAFFEALYVMAGEGLAFEVALCGESFRRQPAEFEQALERLGSRVVHAGYASEERYRELLWRAAITVSCAEHEFFGISIVEALYCQTFAILPFRLSYPELIPEAYHRHCLYDSWPGLLERLRWALRQPAEAVEVARLAAKHAAGFSWTERAPEYDSFLAEQANPAAA
jgi:glycosyltransferase involved in cell wall biosynthesis